ncbi:hypothetical protein [Streptomyces sp. NPDC006739]|uniref:hypothetical protein n=1 Tax=Streptomyces sp. NPDC006739 TaxID=3364763 RepID=UPI0036AC76A2
MSAPHERSSDGDGHYDGNGNGNGNGDGHTNHDGMAEALMSAITGGPPPSEEAAFLREHRQAAADVAVLREQMTWIAEALTGETLSGGGPAGETLSGGGPVGGRGEPSAVPPRFAHAGHPARRRPGRRRVLRAAVGSLAVTAALCVVAGLGWLVTHSAGDSSMSGEASAKGDARAAGQGAEQAGPPPDPALYLACSTLVVEGTVARVEPQSGTSRTRVVLTVTRSYRPAHGPSRVAFLLGADAGPRPRPGQHALVSVGRDTGLAGTWAVGDAQVAAQRAWIVDALPDARRTPCPSGGPSR